MGCGAADSIERGGGIEEKEEEEGKEEEEEEIGSGGGRVEQTWGDISSAGGRLHRQEERSNRAMGRSRGRCRYWSRSTEWKKDRLYIRSRKKCRYWRGLLVQVFGQILK